MISAPNLRDWIVLFLSKNPGPLRASFTHCSGEPAPHVMPGSARAKVTSSVVLPCRPAAATTVPLADGSPDLPSHRQ